MPRAPKRSALTGCRRRKPKRQAIRRRRAGGGGRSHPSSSSSVVTTTLRVARPPLLSCRPPYTPPRDNIPAPVCSHCAVQHMLPWPPARQHCHPRHRCRRPLPQPPPHRRMSNVHPCEECRRSASASARDVVSDGERGGRRAPAPPAPPAPCHTPPPTTC